MILTDFPATGADRWQHAITIVVYGRPAPQGSKRYAGHRRNAASGRISAVLVEQSKRVKPWRDLVTTAARQACAGRPPLDGPLAIEIVFTVIKPASAPKRRCSWPITRHSGDVDKLLRSTFDGITDAHVVVDDSRFIRTVADKVYPGEHPEALDQPGAVIRIYTLTGASQ